MKVIFLKQNIFYPVGRITEVTDSIAASLLKQEIAIEYKKENNPIIQKKLYGTTDNRTK